MEAHVCVCEQFVQGCTQKRGGQESNQWPIVIDRKSNTVSICHQATLLDLLVGLSIWLKS